MEIPDLLKKLKLSASARPKKSAVSIYIGPNTVEIAQLNSSGKKISVVKSFQQEISQGQAPGENPKTKIAEAIKEIFLTQGIKDETVTTTVPEQSIMLRRFTMPLVPAQDREAAVLFEAKRHIPFNINEVSYAFHIIREDRRQTNMEVLFVAAKREEAIKIISILEAAGLTVERIEPISLALIKSLTLGNNLASDCPPTAVLYFSTATRAHILIVEHSIPYLKREFSLLSRDENIEERITTELRLSANYYKREFPEKNINKLIIAGLKEAPSWQEKLQRNFSIPVEQARPLQALTGVDLPAPQLEVALGLASQRLSRPLVDINLLPREMVPVKYNIQKIASVEIAIATGILVLVWLFQLPGTISMRRKTGAAQEALNKYPQLEISGKTTAQLKELKEQWQKKDAMVGRLTSKRINWYKKLSRLEETIPRESWISELKLSAPPDIKGKRKLTFKGYTYSENQAQELEINNNFFKKIKKDATLMSGFTQTSLGTMHKTTVANHEVVDFSITLE